MNRVDLRMINESLAYSLHSVKIPLWLKELVIEDFYHALNRRKILTNQNVEIECLRTKKILWKLEGVKI